MMSVEVWPFLVSRNKSVDYRAVVAPDFMIDAGIAGLLRNAAGGELTGEGDAWYREVHNTKEGDLTLIFRVIRAMNEGDVLRDGFGREIDRTEGIVLKGRVGEIGVSSAHLQHVTTLLEEHFRRFWEQIDEPAIIPSEAFTLEYGSDTNDRLRLTQIEPYNTSPQPAGVSRSWKLLTSIRWNYEVTTAVFNPQVNLFALGGPYRTEIYVYESNFFKRIRHITPKDKGLFSGALAFNAQGTVLAFIRNKTGLRNKGSKVFYIVPEENENIKFYEATSEADTLLQAINFGWGDQFACGSNDGRLYFYDDSARTWYNTEEGHSSVINSISYSPDRKYIITGSNDHRVGVWEVSSPYLERLNEMRELHSAAVTSVAFSSTGHMFATGSKDRTIGLSKLTGGAQINLIGHGHTVNSVAFSPDNKTLASGSSDMTIKLWDISNAKEFATIEHHKDAVTTVAFSRDGQYLVSGDKSGVIHVWAFE